MPKLTQKGQVTIPKHIRSVLGVEPLDEVVFEYDGNQVVVKKMTGSVANLKKYVGYLATTEFRNVDELVDALRGDVHDCSGC